MDLVRADDCKELMTHFFLRLLRDAVGDADPEEIEGARKFITDGTLVDGDLVSPFNFQQLCIYVDLPVEVVEPVFKDLQLIGWRKNSMIFRAIVQRLTTK